MPPPPYAPLSFLIYWKLPAVRELQAAVLEGAAPLQGLRLEVIFEDPAPNLGRCWVLASLPPDLFREVAGAYLDGLMGGMTFEGMTKYVLNGALRRWRDGQAGAA